MDIEWWLLIFMLTTAAQFKLSYNWARVQVVRYQRGRALDVMEKEAKAKS